jgi:hypothetical protein
MKPGAMVRASDDKTIPAKFGPEIPPNYYCRGRNTKRQKYCKARAGYRTDHVGIGRCWIHGGANQNADRMKSGKHARIAIPAVRDAIEKAAKEANPLDMLPTLAKAKGLLDHAIATYAGDDKSEIALADLTRALDTTSKIAYRIEQQRGMIATDRVRLFMEQLRLIIEEVVLDNRVREKLYARIDGIRA